MIDTHAHILPGIDDGAKDILESVEMAKKAKNAGFNGIVCTSHYLRHNYELRKDNIKKIFDNFKNELVKHNINIDLYMGNEVYVDAEITDLITLNTVYTINSTKYILIELPMNHKIHRLDDIIFKIQNLDLNPIIAHPERYSYVQENPNILLNLIENGVLFQANFGSIIGVYGKTVEKTVKILLKHNMIHLLGTDSHNINIYSKMPEIQNRLNKNIDSSMIEILCSTNPKKIVNNQTIEIAEPINYKKRWIF